MKSQQNFNIHEFTRLSSKGQIVLPKDVREELHTKKGDLFGIAVSHDIVILKKMSTKISQEDLEILEDLKEAWKEIEKGDSITMSKKDFIKEIDSW